MNILVRATNWIGDAVMSLPALRAIRGAHPAADITVLARPWVADLYHGERSINRVLPLHGANGLKDLSVKWSSARSMRRERFDLGILFPNSFESAAALFAAGAKRRIGYARDGRSFLLTDAVAIPKQRAQTVTVFNAYVALNRSPSWVNVTHDR